MAYEVYVGPIGAAHPDPEIAFEIELEILEGEAFDVAAGLRSQWPFWGRLSRAFRVGRLNEWFGKPTHKSFLSRCERHVTHGEALPFQVAHVSPQAHSPQDDTLKGIDP